MKKFFRKIFYWENWSYNAIYAPLGVVWLYYAIRARAFWFFTPVNPTLIFAGFEGGSKNEVYEQLPAWSMPVTLLIESASEFEQVKQKLQQAGLQYPVVAKPDSGMQGVLFRIIYNEEALMRYHAHVGEKYILQTFVDFSYEFSVFHIRYPGNTKGKITGLITKDYLHVMGDGENNLGQLVSLHPKAKSRIKKMENNFQSDWNRVLQAGEKFILDYAGNHVRGARFINLHQEIDLRLSDVFDKLSNETGQFYFGRYDLKCSSLEDLKNGKNIRILEFNGAGAATIQIFDCNMSYWQALKVIVRHWDDLYKIGRINYHKGVPYWSFLKGRRFLKNANKNFKRMKAVDAGLL